MERASGFLRGIRQRLSIIHIYPRLSFETEGLAVHKSSPSQAKFDGKQNGFPPLVYRGFYCAPHSNKGTEAGCIEILIFQNIERICSLSKLFWPWQVHIVKNLQYLESDKKENIKLGLSFQAEAAHYLRCKRNDAIPSLASKKGPIL